MNAVQIRTPIGHLTLTEVGGYLVQVRWRDATTSDSSPLLEEAARQIAAYLAGHLKSFDLPLAPAASATAQTAREVMLAVSYGTTATYGELAARTGTSPREFGQQCGANPLPIIVPCHRVLSARGLGQYSGGDGPRTKAWLLALEGSVLL